MKKNTDNGLPDDDSGPYHVPGNFPVRPLADYRVTGPDGCTVNARMGNANLLVATMPPGSPFSVDTIEHLQATFLLKGKTDPLPAPHVAHIVGEFAPLQQVA